MFFKGNNLTTDFLHVYHQGNYTGTTLTQMTDDYLKYIDNKCLVGAVLLDFSSAFDVLDPTLLLDKLKCYKCAPYTIWWFNSYLSNRKKQYVFYNGSYSNVKKLQCVVPQGSFLGSLLFSIFTNLIFLLF